MLATNIYLSLTNANAQPRTHRMRTLGSGAQHRHYCRLDDGTPRTRACDLGFLCVLCVAAGVCRDGGVYTIAVRNPRIYPACSSTRHNPRCVKAKSDIKKQQEMMADGPSPGTRDILSALRFKQVAAVCKETTKDRRALDRVKLGESGSS